MKIAIFSSFFSPQTVSYVRSVIDYLEKKEHSFILVDRFKEYLDGSHVYFNNHQSIKEVDFLFSVGGDGTLLRSITLVRDSGIPILGINTGRLGFLTSLHRDELEAGLDLFFDGKYSCVERALLEVNPQNSIPELQETAFALNEVSVNRKNTTSMLSIQTELDGQHLTTYWSDGLIISTPTGSTGYSLSSGGPIVSPEAQCLILNPIAPHNINMRPLIVPDQITIKISVSGRDRNHLLSLDSRIFTIDNGNNLMVKKAAFNIRTVQLEGDFFFKTLREKLFWGQDSRNTQ
ncbi:MAG: NAD kinase [Flavobacteriaceae bacterium]